MLSRVVSLMTMLRSLKEASASFHDRTQFPVCLSRHGTFRAWVAHGFTLQCSTKPLLADGADVAELQWKSCECFSYLPRQTFSHGRSTVATTRCQCSCSGWATTATSAAFDFRCCDSLLPTVDCGAFETARLQSVSRLLKDQYVAHDLEKYA